MGIDADSQKDLSLQDEDAENVIGGTKKKKAQHKAPAHATGPRMINVQGPVPGGPIEYVQPDDCSDPNDEPGGAGA